MKQRWRAVYQYPNGPLYWLCGQRSAGMSWKHASSTTRCISFGTKESALKAAKRITDSENYAHISVERIGGRTFPDDVPRLVPTAKPSIGPTRLKRIVVKRS